MIPRLSKIELITFFVLGLLIFKSASQFVFYELVIDLNGKSATEAGLMGYWNRYPILHKVREDFNKSFDLKKKCPEIIDIQSNVSSYFIVPRDKISITYTRFSKDIVDNECKTLIELSFRNSIQKHLLDLANADKKSERYGYLIAGALACDAEPEQASVMGCHTSIEKFTNSENHELLVTVTVQNDRKNIMDRKVNYLIIIIIAMLILYISRQDLRRIVSP